MKKSYFIVLYFFWANPIISQSIVNTEKLFSDNDDGFAASAELMGSGKSEKDGIIIFNPKEWPKFIGVLIFFAVGYYLYDFLNSLPEITSVEYYYGLAYLLLLTFIPTLYNLFKLIRDRNDYVKISSDTLSYRDNATKKEFKFSDIKKSGLNHKVGITLTFSNDEKHLIPLKNMNFNVRDSINLNSVISARLPKQEQEQEK